MLFCALNPAFKSNVKVSENPGLLRAAADLLPLLLQRASDSQVKHAKPSLARTGFQWQPKRPLQIQSPWCVPFKSAVVFLTELTLEQSIPGVQKALALVIAATYKVTKDHEVTALFITANLSVLSSQKAFSTSPCKAVSRANRDTTLNASHHLEASYLSRRSYQNWNLTLRASYKWWCSRLIATQNRSSAMLQPILW